MANEVTFTREIHRPCRSCDGTGVYHCSICDEWDCDQSRTCPECNGQGFRIFVCAEGDDDDLIETASSRPGVPGGFRQ